MKFLITPHSSLLAIASLGLVFSFCFPALHAREYSLSRAYNSYERISDAGDVARTDINVNSSSRPGHYSEVRLKSGSDFNGFFSTRYELTALLPTSTWSSGWLVELANDQKCLVQHSNSSVVTSGQRAAGGSIYDISAGTLTRLDPSSPSSWFLDRSESGYVAGHRNKLGLGHQVSQFIPEPPFSTSVPWYTSVPIVVSPQGAVIEVPHPNGEPYGYFRQETSPFDILRDNQAIMTGVNESGLSCGTGWEFGSNGGFGSSVNRLSFTYNISNGATKIIPNEFGFGSIEGAAGINDLGEVVGVYGSFELIFWIYLPTANYGLPAGTHVIHRSPSEEHSWGSRLDSTGNFISRDVKINNQGQVIFPVWFPVGDVLS